MEAVEFRSVHKAERKMSSSTPSGMRQIFLYCVLCCLFLGLILLNRFLYGLSIIRPYLELFPFISICDLLLSI